MLKKLNLDGTKDYEISVASYHIAEMVVAFIQGHKHVISIGAGVVVEKWDDLILQEDNLFRHIQIKRQNTDFSNEPCIRNKYTAKKRIGLYKDLSKFDETLKSLADWIEKKDPTTIIPKRLFEIHLPEGSVYIKKEIQINDLKKLCEDHIKPVTTVQGLKELQSQDISINHCYDWLTTWCGFGTGNIFKRITTA